MNKPTKLRFNPWLRPEVEFMLLDWRPHKGLAFVRDADNRPQVIDFLLPGLLARRGMGVGVVLPSAAPTTIAAICLVPPPCRTTEQEADSLRAAAAEAHAPSSRSKSATSSKLPNWELIWLRHRHEVLLPAPEDEVALAQRLEAFKARMRQEYDARKQELDDWESKTIGQMIYLGGGRFYRELCKCKPSSMPTEVERRRSLLENSFARPLSEFLGRPSGGFLNWTLEVARHKSVLRDPVLHERWARENNLKLSDIDADKVAFVNWYRAHCPAPMPRAASNVFDILPPSVRIAAAAAALAAEVRFLVRFSDGSRVWLADCPRRDPLLTAEEQRPFEARVPSAEPARQPLDPTVGPDEASPSPPKQETAVVQPTCSGRSEGLRQASKARRKARFESDFFMALIPRSTGDPLRITIEPELRALIGRIIEAGGQIPRTKLREGKGDNYQPEKLLRSKSAKALMKAGLLGTQAAAGRTVVYWAKRRSE